MKNVRQYFQECFAAEKPKFLRVMNAVPPDQADYRPHPRSTHARDLVWLLAAELHDACELVDHGEVRFVPRNLSPATLLDQYGYHGPDNVTLMLAARAEKAGSG